MQFTNNYVQLLDLMQFPSNCEDHLICMKQLHMYIETFYSLQLFKAAGDKLLMNKFMRQNFGGGLTLKNGISSRFGSRFR